MAFGGGMRALSLESGVALVALDPRGAASPLARAGPGSFGRKCSLCADRVCDERSARI